MATKDMAESEKNRAQEELTKREMELKSAQEQHQELNKKLQDLQSKVGVSVGGRGMCVWARSCGYVTKLDNTRLRRDYTLPR